MHFSVRDPLDNYYIELAGTYSRARGEARELLEALLAATTRYSDAGDPLRHIVWAMLQPVVVAAGIYEWGGRLYGAIESPDYFATIGEIYDYPCECHHWFEGGQLWQKDLWGGWQCGPSHVIAVAASLEDVRRMPDGWYDPEIYGYVYLRFRRGAGLPPRLGPAPPERVVPRGGLMRRLRRMLRR